MARFIKGDIVVIPFPFSDLSGSKRRPAFVINTLPGNDILLCQITSKTNKDRYSISITSPISQMKPYRLTATSGPINYLPLTKALSSAKLEH